MPMTVSIVSATSMAHARLLAWVEPDELREVIP